MGNFGKACGLAYDLYSNEVTIDDLVRDYMVEKFGRFTSPVNNIPDAIRFEHMLATGRTGCGKSSFFEGLQVKDVQLALQRKRTLILVDPVNGIDKFVKFANVHKAKNCFLIDPADEESMPCLNLFETSRDRGAKLKTSHMIGTFKSMCSGLIDQELTPPMQTLFGYCARVLMNGTDPTLHDLLSLLEDPITYMEGLGMLPEDPVYEFFVKDVIGDKRNEAVFKKTVIYIRGRIHNVLQDPIIERLLVNKRTTFSLAKAIEYGSIILIATRKTDLGSDGARLLGKYILTIVHRVVQERVHMTEDQMKPVMLYVDEFQNCLSDKGKDETLSAMLDENRKFKLGLHLATTRFGKISTEMGDAVLNCTGTKVCGTMIGAGSSLMAPELGRTTKDLNDIEKFNLFVKVGAGDKKAVRIKTKKDPLRKLGKPNPRAMGILRRRMSDRFGDGYLTRENKAVTSSPAAGSGTRQVLSVDMA